jgi:site-specific DNA recombinase
MKDKATPKTEAVVYIRVSTSEQTQGYSLEVQEQACRRMASQKGLQVSEVFSDPGHSARSLERPGLERLMEYVVGHKRRVAAVIVHKVDRLSRRNRDYAQIQGILEALGVALITADGIVSDSDEGILMGTIHAGVAEYENRLRGRRAKDGMIACVHDGRWPWQAPLGYENGRDECGKAALRLDPKRAPHVGRLFEQFGLRGRSLVELSHLAKALGLSGRRGGAVSPAAIRDMLSHPVYRGDVCGFGVRQRGRHEPIASSTVLRAVRERLGEGRRPRAVYSDHSQDFPLRGFVSCPECSTALTAAWSTSKTGKKYPYYRGRTPSCCGRSVRSETLEEEFRQLLRDLAPSPDIACGFSQAVREELDARLSGARQQLARLDNRLEELRQKEHQLVEAHVYRRSLTEERFNREMGLLESEERSIREEIETVETCQLDVADVLRFAADCVAHADNVWGMASTDIKRRFQSLVFPEGITFKDGKFGTPALSPIFGLIGAYEASKECLASPTGFEPVLPP